MASRLRSRLRAGGGGTDADALAWASAVTANSGTYSAATLTAVDTFVKAAKASGYWTKLNRINLFAGDQLAAALVPLKVGGGNATDTNVNFVAGDYTEATGLTGDGTTKYLRTGLIPSVSLTANDVHMAMYNRSGGVFDSVMGILQGGAGAQNLRLYAPLNDGKIYFDAYNQTDGRAVSSILTAPFGLLTGSRTSAGAIAVYEGGTSVGSAATSGGTVPTTEAYIFAVNVDGVAASHTAQPIGAYSIGSGLSAADVTAYNTHMEAFQDALGRGVI